jgi:hypothetical protein
MRISLAELAEIRPMVIALCSKLLRFVIAGESQEVTATEAFPINGETFKLCLY